MSESPAPRVIAAWIGFILVSAAVVADAPAWAQQQAREPALRPASTLVNSAAATILKNPQAAPAASQSNSAKPAERPKPLGHVALALARAYERASSSFSSFCKDWEHKLQERERYNLHSVHWHLQGGQEVGEYLGYSKIQSCTCKRSRSGVPVGLLTYRELEYRLIGKTIDEAMHAKPQAVPDTDTTEIFRWDTDKWAY